MSIFAEIAVQTEVLQQPQHILLFETRQNLYTERKTNLEFSLNALVLFLSHIISFPQTLMLRLLILFSMFSDKK